jgi:hypothetical protein
MSSGKREQLKKPMVEGWKQMTPQPERYGV